MKTCPKCNKEHTKPGTFCSRPCANSRQFTAESNAKKATSYSKWYSGLTLEERKRITNRQHPLAAIQKRKETIAAKYENMAWDDLPLTKKKKMIKAEQENKCLSCDLDNWLGNELLLEVDHIDGNSDNNSRSNLRGLCPNCHSQTPTWRKGWKTPQPTDEEILAAYSVSKSMTEILTRLSLKWGSFVLVVKALERQGITVYK